MIYKIDTTKDTPIYIQIRNMFVNLIAYGELKKGDPIPSVRSLASDLNLNIMTVQKAYTLLKDEGFIEVDRSVGSRIYSEASLKCEAYEENLEDLFKEAIARGYSKDEVEVILDGIYDNSTC